MKRRVIAVKHQACNALMGLRVVNAHAANENAVLGVIVAQLLA